MHTSVCTPRRGSSVRLAPKLSEVWPTLIELIDGTELPRSSATNLAPLRLALPVAQFGWPSSSSPWRRQADPEAHSMLEGWRGALASEPLVRCSELPRLGRGFDSAWDWLSPDQGRRVACAAVGRGPPNVKARGERIAWTSPASLARSALESKALSSLWLLLATDGVLNNRQFHARVSAVCWSARPGRAEHPER